MSDLVRPTYAPFQDARIVPADDTTIVSGVVPNLYSLSPLADTLVKTGKVSLCSATNSATLSADRDMPITR